MRSQMSLIMDLIGPELFELCALELENLPSLPNLATIYTPIKFQMNLVMGQIEPEHPELFALEFRKIAESDFVYTLASTNVNQSALNLVKMNVSIRSRVRSIMDLFGPELSELSGLKLENLTYLTLFTL